MNTEKINILLVEDDPGFTRLFELMMKKETTTERFNIQTAQSMKDCFTTLESGDTDIVLLDLGLSETTGLETIEKFHKNIKRNIGQFSTYEVPIQIGVKIPVYF